MKKISAELLYQAMSGIGDDLLEESEAGITPSSEAKEGPSFTQLHAPADDLPDHLSGQLKERSRRTATKAAKRKALLQGVLLLAAVVLLGIGARFLMRGQTLLESSSDSAPKNVLLSYDLAQDTMESAEGEGVPAEEGAAEEIFDAARPESVTAGFDDGAENAADDAVAADMPAFFTLRGATYTEVSVADAGKFRRGEKIATITAKITETDDAARQNTEGAGTVTGDVYLVEGYDGAILLCMTDEETSALFLFLNEEGASPAFLEENGILLPPR